MKREYQVKDGHRHGRRNEHGPGDIVELTEDEASGFLDKLELITDDAPSESADDLTQLTGLGASMQTALNEVGITTFVELLEADTENLTAIRGISADKVTQWKAQIVETHADGTD